MSTASSIDQPKLSLLMPVRNEGINLKIMCKFLKATLEVSHEILVIYDDPKDDSIVVIEEAQKTYPNVRLVFNNKGRGVVRAIKSGVEAAKGTYCLIFAADEVGPLITVDEMLSLMDEGCEFVSCTRYAHGGRRLGGSFLGGMLSKTACWLLHNIGGCLLTDASTGIKMFRRDHFGKLNLESKPVGWVVAFEMAIKAQLAGLKLGEVPIVSIDRLYGGKSTFRLGAWIKAYFKWFWFGYRNLRRDQCPPVKVRIPAHSR